MRSQYVTINVKLNRDSFYDYVSFIRKVLESKYSSLIEHFVEVKEEEGLYVLIGILVDGGRILVHLKVREQPSLTVEYDEKVPYSVINNIVHLLEGATYVFCETKGKATIYYVIVPGLEVVPSRSKSFLHKISEMFFTNNLVFLFALSIILCYALWLVFKNLTPIALVISQSILILLSGNIVGLMGDWQITKEHPDVYLVGVYLPISQYEELVNRTLYPLRKEIKTRIYEETIARGIEVTPQYIVELLSQYGVLVKEEDVVIKKFNLYAIVSEVFRKFDLPIPKIKLMNIVIPNAAASGIMAKNSVLLITSGILTKLNEEELKAVIAHEASHLKRRDIISLFLLSLIEYSTRVYVILSIISKILLPAFLLYLYEFLYLYFSLTVLFFVTKFIEARADIDAALRVGKPESLASALRKIGYKRLINESTIFARWNAWLRWNPHPPLTFRIENLLKLSQNQNTSRSPWRIAISTCIKDFVNTTKQLLCS